MSHQAPPQLSVSCAVPARHIGRRRVNRNPRARNRNPRARLEHIQELSHAYLPKSDGRPIRCNGISAA